MEATLGEQLEHSFPSLPVASKDTACQTGQRGLHSLLAKAFLLGFGASWIGSIELGVRSDGLLRTLVAVALVFSVLLPVLLWFHGRGLASRREALLVLPWEILFAVLLPYQALMAARLGLPLQDALLQRLDAQLGVHIPALVMWTRAHPALAAITDLAYRCLQPLLIAAALLPAFTGRLREAQRFLVANLCAIALSLPLFTLLPAIGPWVVMGQPTPPGGPASFAATAQQHSCERLVMALHQPGPFLYRFGSALPIISFPSFHVIWAVLSARAFWNFRLLRGPLAVLTGLVVVSTMTTGWHYGVDVLAGLAVAAVSLAFANRIVFQTASPPIGTPP